MKRESIIIKELAIIDRKLAEVTNETAKEALRKKRDRLKAELKDPKQSTNVLAKKLLAEREAVKQLSKVDFNDLIRRLSKKPEYAFLKSMNKGVIRNDIERKAKPVGWRFRGRGNYDKPTKAEIAKGKKSGEVYREVRPRRSDVSFIARLKDGGNIGIYEKLIDKKVNWKDRTYEVKAIYKNSENSKGATYQLFNHNTGVVKVRISKDVVEKLLSNKEGMVRDSYGNQFNMKLNTEDKMKDGGSMYAGGGGINERYNLSFNYNPGNLSNKDAEKIVSAYTKDWKHDNDPDEVSFYVNGLTKEKAEELKKELKMEDTYDIEITKSRYAGGGSMYAGGGDVVEYKIKEQSENSVIVELPFNAYKTEFDLDDRINIKRKVNEDLKKNFDWWGYSVENDKTYVVLGKRKYETGGSMYAGGGTMGNEVIFSVNDETLDMLLHDHHDDDLDYVEISGDSYYKLNRRDFDRFIDAADSKGFNVDYENDEDAVIYVLENDRYDKGGNILTSDEEKQFQDWFNDGNVIELPDGNYATQDAQYSNRLHSMDEVKRYFKKEFLSYATGGSMYAFGGMIDEDNLTTGQIIRMSDLVPQDAEDNMIASAEKVMNDLLSEGFEREEVFTYIAHILIQNVKDKKSKSSGIAKDVQDWSGEYTEQEIEAVLDAYEQAGIKFPYFFVTVAGPTPEADSRMINKMLDNLPELPTTIGLAKEDIRNISWGIVMAARNMKSAK